LWPKKGTRTVLNPQAKGWAHIITRRLNAMSKGESSGESPLLDEPGRKPGVRERRFAQVFKDVTNTLESDVESLLDESSEGDWFATEGGTPQPGIEVRAEAELCD
jgi:hypothetical protein